MSNSLGEIFFSVVIPLYNKEKYISDTLQSVLVQTYSNFEVIIVNDGSTDRSLEKVAAFAQEKIRIFNITNSGVSVARNVGIKAAKGDYIALLDADDYWYPNHLYNFESSIVKFPLEQVFCNNYKILLQDNLFKIPIFSDLPTIIDENYLLITDYFKSSYINSIAWTSAICISKTVFKDGNYWFDEEMNSGQDTDLWVRLGLNYFFVFNYKISAIHKKNILNSLSHINNNYKSRFLMTQKYIQYEKSNKNLKKFIDINRFSVIIKCRQNNDNQKALLLFKQIDIKNLNAKQRLLLQCPAFVLISLQSVKSFLSRNFGINFSVFK